MEGGTPMFEYLGRTVICGAQRNESVRTLMRHAADEDDSTPGLD